MTFSGRQPLQVSGECSSRPEPASRRTTMTSGRPLRSRYTISAAGLCALALASLLYCWHPGAYQQVMTVIMRVPLIRPFVDWRWIPSAIQCWSQGVDVYANNTCYTEWVGGKFNYSPLWLRATFLPLGAEWVVPFALSLAALFFASQSLLPRPKTRFELAVRLAATLSGATITCVERANADLLMFLLVVLGVSCTRYRLSIRLLGYCLIILAGLLKFYPFLGLLIVARERASIFAFVTALATVALAALLVGYHDELVRMVINLPLTDYALQFAARDIPAGAGTLIATLLEDNFHQDTASATEVGRWVFRILYATLLISTAKLSITAYFRWNLPQIVRRMPERNRQFAVAAGAIICGCFFAGENFMYREVFLLPILPGLLAFYDRSSDASTSLLGRRAGLVIVFILWLPFLDWLSKLPSGNAFLIMRVLLMLANKMAWWWLVGLVTAMLAAFIADLGPETIVGRCRRLLWRRHTESDAAAATG